ncbi:MAG: cadherin repeat domain-containing protein [Leptolyngbyaceae cyanobacterium CRU_2_3]|nr:cadherin repeat domain-containing protein [Leptolyngbyaceae cyanobacterium CRU_2_3]
MKIAIADVPEASTGVSLELQSIDGINENISANTAIGTIRTQDPDEGDTFTYTFIDGTGATDNALFEIVGDSLRIKESPNFEAKNSYTVRIRSTNDQGGFIVDNSFSIAVKDINENPTDLSLTPQTIAENQPANTEVGTFSSVDPEGNTGTFTYTLVAGTGSDDNAAFTISGNRLLANGPFDVDANGAKTSYSVRVRTTDGQGLSFEKQLTVVVTPVNEDPTGIGLTSNQVDENVPNNTLVGNLLTTDPDAGNTFAYALVPGAGGDDNGAFTIVKNDTTNVYELRTNAPINYEAKTSYTIRVRTTDQGGLSFEQPLTVTVNDLVEAPDNQAPTDLSLTPSDILENSGDNAIVGTFSTNDPNPSDTAFTYTLVDGVGATDNAAFAIDVDPVTGVSSLRILSSPDFESDKKSYEIRVRTRDVGGLSTDKALTINVQDVNEAPTQVNLSNLQVQENVPANTAIGILTTDDLDKPATVFTYEFVTGAGSTDNNAFTIVKNSAGDYELRINASPNFETTTRPYEVRIKSTDGDNLSTETQIKINVTDINEAPTGITLTPDNEVDENVVPGTVVGNFQTTDEDDKATEKTDYKLVTGEGDTDNSLFTLTQDGQLSINTTPNFETKDTYTIRVEVADKGGLTFTDQVTIKVKNLDDSDPTQLNLSKREVEEKTGLNTPIGILTTEDPDENSTFTYTLVPGFKDNDAFTIERNANNDYVLILKNPADFDTKPTYDIKVRTTDNTGRSLEQEFPIKVNPVNEAPTKLELDNTELTENTTNPVVGKLITTDPDQSDTAFFYTLDAGFGDNAAFTIVGDTLQINAPPDFETKDSYNIRITSRDRETGGLSITQAFRITIKGVPEAPTALSLSANTVDENSPINTFIGTFSTKDDAGDTHTYTLTAGDGSEDNAAFEIVNNPINGNVELRIKVVPDVETKDKYSILVKTTDSTGRSLDQKFTILVNGLPEAPVITASTGTLSYTEGSGAIKIDPGIQVLDVDSPNLTGAAVTLIGYVPGQDSLGFTTQGAIQGSFDAATGILTLTGTATQAAYTAALQSITYTNSSSNPNTTNRTVRFTATDGTNTSNITSRPIQILATNTAPTIATSAGNLAYTENSGAVAIDPAIKVDDVDSPTLSSATIALDNYIAQQDLLSFNNLNNGITGNFDAATGILTLSGVASLANYQTALQSIQYTNLSSNPTLSDRVVRFSVTDGAATSNIASRSIQLLATNTAPVVTASSGILSYTENSAAIPIDVGLIVSDADSDVLRGQR